MSGPDPRLTGLVRIAGTLRAASLARLAAADAEMRRIEAEIAALNAPARPAGSGADIAVQAAIGAAQVRWQMARRAELVAELERARAAHATCLHEARRAVGRDAALARLRGTGSGLRRPDAPDR